MTQGSEPQESIDLIFSEVKERLNIQFQAIDSLDGKAGLILTAGSLVISIAAGLQASMAQAIRTGPLVVLIVGAIAYALCMIYALLGFWVRDYRRDPDPGALVEHYSHEGAESTKKQIVANWVDSFSQNIDTLKDKACYIRCAMVFLSLETSILATALIWRSL